MQATLDKIVALSKRRGFIYPTSEIYGGLESSYDYGYYGTLLKNNIRDLWWHKFVTSRSDMIGIDSTVIQHPQTWVASGHVAEFNDAQVDDLKTKERYRADHLIENWIDNNKSLFLDQDLPDVEGMNLDEMASFIKKYDIKSPAGNEITEPRLFNQLFETHYGVLRDEESKVYLRGETAQGIFTNFKPIIDSMRVQLPFGVGQVGKSFRNEITKGQFVFRTLEFEQMEIEYFIDPETSDWREIFKDWQEEMKQFYMELGLAPQNLRYREHSDKERSHYSSQTFDIDYKFDFGFKELLGLAYRSDYDLKQHAHYSGKDLVWHDPQSNRKFIPHVIEPAAGLNRALLAVLFEAYTEEDLGENRTRTVLKIPASIAPIQIAVFPLQKDAQLTELSQKVYTQLSKDFVCELDNGRNIGKMYRRQDEIGTPFCVTIDFDSLETNQVTVRFRDSMKQQRVSITELSDFINDRLQRGA